jgi:UDP-N-acetylglucosamine 3-dehydrogenase
MRLAVIGAGNMGRNHVRNYSEMVGVKLVAIADPSDAAKELAKKYKAKYYADYREMLKLEQLDGVSIAVPTKFHRDVAAFAMEQGINVLLEKPIAASLDEADELIALAKRKKLIFTIGHIERYNPVVLKMRNLVSSGRLGEISSIISTRIGGFPKVEPETDVILDLAVHDIDILAFVSGKEPHVEASHGSKTFHSSNWDSAEILLKLGSASGFIQANWVTPVKIRTIAITGSRGYAVANYITQAITFHESSYLPYGDEFKNYVETFARFTKHVDKGELEEPLRNELTAFIQSIKDGRAPERLVKPEDARLALDVAMKASKLAGKAAKV